MTLKNQRAGHRSALSKIHNSVSDKCSQEELLHKLESARNVNSKIIHLQREIIDMAKDEGSCEEEETWLTEHAQFFSLLESRILELLRASSQSPNHDSEASHPGTKAEGTSQLHDSTNSSILMAFVNQQTQINELIKAVLSGRSGQSPKPLQLPDLEIPKFDGTYKSWISFRDLFVASVHNNTDISDAQKHQLLMGLLTPEAASKVKHIPISDANYTRVWSILQKKYEKHYNIVADHVQTFLALPFIKSADKKNLRQIHSIAEEVTNALDAINENSRDPWLIQFLNQRVDSQTRSLWEVKRKNLNIQSPTWEDYLEFLNDRCDVLEACNDSSLSTSNPSKKNSQPENSKKKSTTLLATQSDNNNNNCVCCGKDTHPLFRCPVFLEKNPQERFDVVRNSKLCRNCLNSRHLTNNCDRSLCQRCRSRHNTLLHDAYAAYAAKQNVKTNDITSNHPESQHSGSNNSQPSGTIPKQTEIPRTDSQHTSVGIPSSINHSSANSSPKVLLSTCMVNVLDSHRVVHKCRAVLDSGAQQSMMTENLRERLQLRRSPDNTLIIGCNNSYSKVKGRSQLLVLSSNLDDSYEFNCLVVPQVTGKLPNFLVNPLSVQIPSQITLSDPNWCVESPVDLLIGMDHYNDVVLDGVIRQGSDQPVLRQTVFGWVLSGALKDASTAPPPHSQCNMVTLASLEKTVKRFWEIEEVECAKSTSVENVEVEEHFAATFSREDSGRFIVQLPLRPNHTELGNSKKRAIRQLRSLEDRLKKLPDMRALYNESMDNYLTKGYMTEIPRRDDDSNHFYLPHHGVWKPSSSSTKLRVVFNASAKTSSGLSLNDVLKVGPTVQPDLVTVLMRFRLNPYAMKCDVSQMYLQVKLHEPHADFQRILWRNSDTEPIREYKINRVCFGVASSPYLATKVLNQLAEMEKQDFPLGSQAVTSNFYVDDGLISCSSLDTALQTQSQLGELMAHGGFTLAKWCATHPELLENVTKSSQDPKLLHSPDDDNSVEVLGIKWDPQKDVFHYSVPPDFASPIATRRTIASTIARLYDPLGLIGPVITEGKILIQMSWQKELAAGWDTELPPQIQDRWTKYVQGLHRINDIQIPRWVSEIHDPDLTELHGFADSSQAAYGAAVYVVTRGKDSSISSHLLISKSRIAPMDPLTIPKLELCAAELCAKLVARVQRDLNISKAHLWSDSTVALSWICSTREKPNLFVRKRVQSVLKLSDASQWRHVGTSDNPADLISRGCSPEALINSTLWFHGPSWLSLDPSNYPNTLSASLPLPSENEQTISVNFSAHQEDTLLSRLLDRCSRVSRLQGIVAQCIRATTPSTRRSKGPLSPQEMDNALMILIRLDQQAHFPELIESLKNESLNNKHVKNFANLQPFLDAKGLVRVGGRLERSQFGYDTKHPILLPYSRLTKLLAQREHVRQMHCGSESLLAYLRQRFWPIKGRNLTRGVTRACIHCFRVFPHLQRQLMGQLPEHRTTLDRPFSSTSVDFAGPLQLRPARRGGAITKVWVAIFVCHSTKAIHIELVSNLSTEAFVASFRRFVARRSTPSHLFMDNATNFTGSKNELDKLFHQEVHQNSVQNKLVSLGIQFHFQPPDGPHHNGLVEAAVKSVKTHLHRVVGSCPLSYEELQTILTQVEAVLNSRPLTPISTDASDPAVLTPGHFLTGGPLTSLPDPSLQTLSMNHLSRWQLCQRLYQDFATRWKRDYIHQLQERKKWKKSEPNVRVGDLALLSKDNEPSIRWPLGEITHVHPGPDGLVRVVDIRTATGTYRRPITRLALLPRVQFLREDVRATASSLKAATPTGISDL